MGRPIRPYTSQNREGKSLNAKVSGSTPHLRSRFSMASDRVPGFTIPDRSLLISLRKTGTPISLNPSASTFRVTVFPVPVAPAISPCRFAISGRRKTGPVPQLPIWIFPSRSTVFPPIDPSWFFLPVLYTFRLLPSRIPPVFLLACPEKIWYADERFDPWNTDSEICFDEEERVHAGRTQTNRI